jgi:hypothetical protein
VNRHVASLKRPPNSRIDWTTSFLYFENPENYTRKLDQKIVPVFKKRDLNYLGHGHI